MTTSIRKSCKEAIKRHTAVLREKLIQLRSASQAEVIKMLNPIIWGWAAYYRTVISSQTFAHCDRIIWHQLWSWARKRHRNKGNQWIAQRYWHSVEHRNWVFSTPEKAQLRTQYHENPATYQGKGNS
ncbi:group II intron maturase-specific domain-containing protein [Ktedonobacter sp. SOSP1-85]|uniref:group II intron maturase-specific domain-containing protein n=1 Tax=Ktedonobacter sp. SOSP1-85 TaxID=2778367 RepID=UPI001F34886B|nr:group II intron maturase-specific domain-containing protein [Ktedonobacter sp. SOSP1-85]